MRGTLALAVGILLAPMLAYGLRTANQAGAQPAPCTKNPSKNTMVVGTVKDRANATVFVDNKVVVSDSYPLVVENTICTDKSGQVTFELKRSGKTTTCTQLPRTRLWLYPKSKPKLIISFLDGLARCNTSGGVEGWFGVRTRLTLKAKDPLFQVGTDGSRVLIKVGLGYIEVAARSGQAVTIGPFQQVLMSGSDLQSPRPIDLMPPERAGFAALAPLSPKPQLGKPEVSGSPTLAAIFKRKEMIVGFDQRADSNKRVVKFLNSFFSFLGSSWKIAAKPRPSSLEQLRSRKLHAFVTPNKKLGDVPMIPLFADGQGMVWQVAAVGDIAYVNALRMFVSGAFQTGSNAVLYEKAFAKSPSFP